MNFYLINPDAEHRGILLIKVVTLMRTGSIAFFAMAREVSFLTRQE